MLFEFDHERFPGHEYPREEEWGWRCPECNHCNQDARACGYCGRPDAEREAA